MLRIWPKGAALDSPPDSAAGDLEEGQGSLGPAYLVKWDQDDPLNPQNWPVAYKCWVTFQLGMLALAGSLGSSIMTPAEDTIAEYVGVSNEVVVLDVSLYM